MYNLEHETMIFKMVCIVLQVFDCLYLLFRLCLTWDNLKITCIPRGGPCRNLSPGFFIPPNKLGILNYKKFWS